MLRDDGMAVVPFLLIVIFMSSINTCFDPNRNAYKFASD